jgi:hypothetical protein
VDQHLERQVFRDLAVEILLEDDDLGLGLDQLALEVRRLQVRRGVVDEVGRPTHRRLRLPARDGARRRRAEREASDGKNGDEPHQQGRAKPIVARYVDEALEDAWPDPWRST